MSKSDSNALYTKDSAAQRAFLTRVGDDEPIFILRGRDALAVRVIRHWIGLADRHGVNDAKVLAAHAHLRTFQEWQAEHGERLPD